MPHQLTFQNMVLYDPSKEGITIEVHLKLDDKIAILEAKIDTGASYFIFQRKHGESLGLDIESGMPLKVGTVTGSFIAYGHNITLSVLDYHFDTMVYFAASDTFPRNVLGRHGWLEQLQVGIVDYDGKLFLSTY